MTSDHPHHDGLTIRAATNADRERIETLVLEILREFELQADFSSSEADLQDIEASYRGGMFAVVEDQDGKLVGTFGVQRVDDEVAKLRKMYVVKAWRGKRLGRIMLAEALRTARDLGFATMRLETVSTMTDAIRLYTRAGFTLVPQTAVSPRCDQVYQMRLV